MSRHALLLTAYLLATTGAGVTAQEAILVRATRVYPISSKPIDGGAILVREGRIVAVGEDVTAPAGARVVDVDGVVVPGFIDCGSTIALDGRAAEEYSELTPEIHVADALDLDHVTVRRALRAGVTTVAVKPGDRNVVGGLGAVLQTVPTSLESAVLSDAAFLCVSLTDAASSSNRNMRYSAPSSIFHRIPNTRMGTVFLARRALYEALGKPLPQGLKLPGEARMTRLLSDAGRKVLRRSAAGERSIRVRADEKQEILSALRLASEFDIAVSIEGGVEAVDLIPELERRDVSVLVLPGAHIGSPGEANRNRVHDLTRRFEAAGVRFAFFSDDGADVEKLPERVALDVRFGLSEAAALRALTLDAAAILGVADVVGSIEPGKRADLVAFTGDPFALTSRVAWVMASGEIHERDA